MPKKNKKLRGSPRPMRSQPPFSSLTRSFRAAPRSCSKAQPLGSGAKVQSPATLLWGLTPVEHSTLLWGLTPVEHSTLLWGLTPASSLRLIRRPVTRVIRATRSTTAAGRLTLGSSNLSLGLVSPAELHVLLQLFAGEVARRLSQ